MESRAWNDQNDRPCDVHVADTRIWLLYRLHVHVGCAQRPSGNILETHFPNFECS